MTSTLHDLICHMDIDPSAAAGTSACNGQTNYFCSLGCRKSLDTNREKYLGSSDEHKQYY